MSTPALLARETWYRTEDGFSLCPVPLSQLLHRLDIRDTGLSPINPQDVDSYFDDWHLFSVRPAAPVYGLVKLREQEHDFLPGYADRDDPAVTVSFIAFPLDTLLSLPRGAGADTPEMAAFVSAFRDVTERFPQRHDPILQAYFSDPGTQGSYLIAEAYLKKLRSLFPDGTVPLPDKFFLASKRLLQGLRAINDQAGRSVFCPEDGCLRLSQNPTLLERQALLAVHTCNLTLNSFAAEVKFHADALVRWPNHLPYLGKAIWYRAAIRADMQFGPENDLYEALLCPYHHPDSPLVREQATLHGKQ